jgi:hypothetical protein
MKRYEKLSTNNYLKRNYIEDRKELTWTSRDFETLRVVEMETTHIINIIKLFDKYSMLKHTKEGFLQELEYRGLEYDR